MSISDEVHLRITLKQKQEHIKSLETTITAMVLSQGGEVCVDIKHLDMARNVRLETRRDDRLRAVQFKAIIPTKENTMKLGDQFTAEADARERSNAISRKLDPTPPSNPMETDVEKLWNDHNEAAISQLKTELLIVKESGRRRLELLTASIPQGTQLRILMEREETRDKLVGWLRSENFGVDIRIVSVEANMIHRRLTVVW